MLTKPTPEIMLPLVHNRIAGDAGQLFSAACFEGKDWSLGPLQKPEDAKTNTQLATKVGAALGGLGVVRAFAPNPTQFNGKITRQRLLDRDIALPGGVHLFRNQAIPADGTELRREGDAGVFSAGGCGLIVAALGDDLYFAHAGRECVLDRQKVLTRGQRLSRQPESVVDNIVNILAPGKSLRKHLRAWVFYSIKPRDFAHRFADPDPQHAVYNRAAGEFLPQEYGSECGWVDDEAIYIDLPKIMRAQFLRRGVPEGT